MHSRRRHRSVHQPQRWTVRAVCVVAIGGVVALGVWRPPTPVDVESPGGFDPTICVVVEAVIGLMGASVPPPPDGSSADVDAVRRTNEILAQRRAEVMDIPSLKEGC